MKGLRGYTMMEIIIVLALFGILLSIVLPGYGMLDRFKTSQELKELRRDILHARNQAIVNGKTYYFKVDYDNNGYFITTDGTNIKTVTLESGLKLLTTSNTRSIEFIRTGVPNGAGTIKLVSSIGKKYDVSITPIIAKVNIYEVERWLRIIGDLL